MNQASKAFLASSSVLVLTLIHHFYGAVIYSTPWRMHVAFIAVPVLIAMAAVWAVQSRWPGLFRGMAAKWVLIAVAGVVSVAMFGMYEGGYNHLLKNILYYGGLPAETFAKMFPAPTYELPNDLLFELTGILQFFFALWAAFHLYLLARSGRKETDPTRPSDVT